MNQEQINVSIANGVGTVTDNNGNTLPWVNLIYVSLDPGSTPIIYLGCTNFSVNINTAPTATPTGPPSPAPSPPATPTPAPAAT